MHLKVLALDHIFITFGQSCSGIH